MPIDRTRTIRGALAGAVATGVWAAQMPLDKRIFGVGFDDVELLGKAFTRAPAWRAIGLAIHVQNGAVFGAVYANLAPSVPLPSWALGPLAGLVENFATWPLLAVSERIHPARDEIPRVSGSVRGLAQATWRHLVFGVVLGELERRLNAEPDDELEPWAHVISSNGHGNIEHAASLR
ncbi:MAG TPA: hypothetical protein VG165_04180 [Solirubrobacteraceae bacterium]|nr:hypothetical protein [Solirubrobacteraceae bacterium]